MTTLEELSSCPFANRKIHNQTILQAIAFLRDAIDNQHSSAYKVLINPRKITLLKALKARKNQDYLHSFENSKCGVCTHCECQHSKEL